MPLAPGDLLFVGWDGDNDDIAFVTTVDLPAGEVIYFTDDEWDGTAFVGSEQLFEWTVPAGGVPIGTTVTIDMDRGARSVSIDSGGGLDYIRGGYDLAQGNEMFWAFQGTRVGSTVTPTNFIGVIANEADGNDTQTPNLTGTGLTTSNGAIIIDGDEDYMEFTGDGALPDPVTRDDLIAAVSDLSNWTTADGAGNNNPNPGGFFDVALPTVTCFVAGTRIATPGGWTRVERLRPGDLVTDITGGVHALVWTGQRRLDAHGALRPVRFAPGSIGNHAPLSLSPQHRVLITGWRAQLYFDEDEILVPAHRLVNGDSVRRDAPGPVRYCHIMCAAHQVLIAEGAPCESFFPGDAALRALHPDGARELFDLFPELALGETALPLARPELRDPRACLLRP